MIVASVASMIDQFNMQNIELLLEKGYDVDVACNCKEGNTISDERIKALIESYIYICQQFLRVTCGTETVSLYQ